MSSRFTKTGLLFLGIVLASFSPRDAAAGEEDPIPITTAAWITAGMPGAAEGEALPFGF